MRHASILLFAFAIYSCGPNANKLKTELLEMDALFSKAESITDLKAAQSFISKSERFAKAFPADSLSPQFLFKSAGVAKTIGNIDEAYRLWDQLLDQYPDNFWAPPAAFLKGYTAETELADREKALRHFEEFLQRYPESEFAGQARRQIELLKGNKTPEELVKEFEQNQQDTTTVEE